MNNRASLDPDTLAELEREQSFLLRSLDDLDAEHGAGDLDATDHTSLTDDYTRRLAEVTRAIDDQRTAFAKVENRLTGRQRVLTVLAVVAVAVLAGVLLGRASGFRSPEDSVSGDIRRSSAGLLAEADTLTREGQWPEAVAVYDEVLELSPANTEALTYRGWLTARLGDPAAGIVDVAEAVDIDGEFADARVFYAILLDDEQRFDEAAEQLGALDGLDAPAEILGLVEGSDLRASVAAGQIAQRFSDPSSVVDLNEITAPLDDIAQAGNLLLGLDPLLAVKVFSAVLDERPDNVVALVGKGQVLAAVSQADAATAAEGLALLDRAVELEPTVGEVRLFRAQARAAQQDLDGARSDLAEIDVETLGRDYTDLYNDLAGALN